MNTRTLVSLAGCAAAGCWTLCRVLPERTHEWKIPSKMEMLRPGEVKPRGWLRDRCLAAKAGYVSRMDEVDKAFPRAWSGDFHPRGKYLDWTDADKGAWCAEGGAYWFEGLVRLAWELDDPELKDLAKRRLAPLLECMHPNSLGLVYWMDRRDPAQLDELEKANHGFIIGASGRTTRALIAYYEATGDERARRVLTWCLDDPRLYFFGNPVTLPAAGADVWRYGGDGKLGTALANFKAKYPEMPESGWPALRYGRAVTPETIRREERKDKDDNAKWDWRLQHGVLAYESMYSFLKLAQWSGDRKLLGDVIGWADWLERNTRQVHGVTVADEQYGWPGEGRGTETCTVAGDLLLNAALAGVTGEGRFGDHVERAFFNAGAACVSRDWMHHVYFQAPNRTDAGGKFRVYKDKHWPLCCTAALTRILPGFVQWMWMRPADGGVAAVLYGPNTLETELRGVRLGIETRTSYPFDETVEMTVAPARPLRFPLRLRIPGWCVKGEIVVNGKRVEPTVRDGFATLDREWRAGDQVTLRLPMTPKVETMRDHNQGGRPFCSVTLGPLLFAAAIPSVDENTPQKGARTGWTLDSAKVLADAKVTRTAMPAVWSWQEDAPVKVTVKTSAGENLALVPYGCARLRVSMFPDAAVSETWKGAYVEGATDEGKCFYAVGETMTFRLKLGGIGKVPSGDWTFRWKRTGDDGKVEEGTCELPFGKPFVYRTSIDRPGFVRLFAEVVGAGANVRFDGGAGADFDRIVQQNGEPADFDAFWKRELDALAAVPINPQLTEVKSPRPEVKLCRFRLDCTRGKPSTGFISIPRRPGKYPVRLRFFGYNESWEPRATARPTAKETPDDEIVLRVNAHGLENGREAGYYAAARKAAGTNGYGHGFDPAANAKPETCYFLGMVLRNVRAAQFAKTLPEWDGRTMRTYGGSQGGAQGIWVAALERAVSNADVCIPWMCDWRGKAFGGRLGTDWGAEYAPGLDYFDCVNFAKRIRPDADVNVYHAGLGDYICPPSGVAAFFNALPCKKRIRWMQNAEHGWTSPAPKKQVAEFP